MSIIENLTHPAIYAVAWTIIHSLWQFTIIVGLWYGIIHINKNASSTYKYNVSFAGLMALFITAGITFLKEYQTYSSAAKLAAINLPDYGWVNAKEGAHFYFVNNPSFLDKIISEETLPILFWTYLSGLIIFTTITTVKYYNLSLQTKTSELTKDDVLLKQIRKLTIDTGMLKQIKVKISEHISIPAVVGFFKPVILLPAVMLTCLSPAQIESIILHELYHIRRNDHYINLFQQLLEIALFYHPAVWLINRVMRQERENCVDEWVVAKTRQPLKYANALLILEEHRHAQNKLLAAATQSKHHLLTRIKNIMTMKNNQSNSARKIAGMLLLMTALISIAWINPTIAINSKADDTIPPSNSQNISVAKDTLKPIPPTPDPTSIQLEEGEVIAWESLNEDNKQQIREAIKDARIAISEVRSELNSEEFKRDMQEVRQDIKKAINEMNIELKTEFESEEFRKEMEEVGLEVQKALAETGIVIEGLGPVLQETLNTVFEALKDVEITVKTDSVEIREE